MGHEYHSLDAAMIGPHACLLDACSRHVNATSHWKFETRKRLIIARGLSCDMGHHSPAMHATATPRARIYSYI